MNEGLSFVFKKKSEVVNKSDCKSRTDRVVTNTGTTIIKYFNIKNINTP